jgi:hypothetical protein
MSIMNENRKNVPEKQPPNLRRAITKYTPPPERERPISAMDFSFA